MNERIYELAKQADLIKFDTLPWNPDAVTPDQESYSKAMKFAELIIKECASTVQDLVDHRIPASEYPARLTEHFGVK